MRDDDRDEYEPRRRHRRDDDYDDEDYDDDRRPKRSSRKGMNVGLIIGIVVAVLFVCGGPGFYTLFTSITKVKEAAGKMRDTNNLKILGLAMHNVKDVTGGFQGPFAFDEKGNRAPGDLSFRVGLLPYIEQGSLYLQFDLSQAWNSARNRTQSNTVVPMYRSPYATDPTAPMTSYRAFVGGGALFDETGKPVRPSDITDGAFNTIMLICVDDEVPWAAPQELKYSPTGVLPRIGTRGMPTGANVLLADGSVKFLKASTPEPVFRSLITRAGGDLMPVDW
jgi:prepilin-type processing-associated H-X9-DG protein